MKFTYFRVAVTILAAFCPFFAYICRLNLSLTIEEMVPKREPILERTRHELADKARGAVNPSSSADNGRLSSRFDGLFIQTEEHAFATIFSKTVKMSPRVLTHAKKVKPSPPPQRLPSRLPYPHSPLSIEIDASGGREAALKVVEGSGGGAGAGAGAGGGGAGAGGDGEGGTSSIEIHDLEARGGASRLLHWDDDQRNNLLGAFFLGYVMFMIPSARAAELLGPKILILFAGLGSTLTSLAFPYVARLADGAVWPAYLLRVLMGAAQSGLFPASYVFICEWMPVNERPRWLSYPASLSRIGTIVMNLSVPYILATHGWEATFYVSGLVTLVWTVLFTVFGSNSPNDSYWISKEELIYIESHKEPRVGRVVATPAAAGEVTGSGFTINEAAHKPQKPPISWRRLATNRPLLILAIVMFASEWSNLLLLIKLPGFLGPAMKFEIGEIGLWSSVLVFIFCIQYPLSSYLASRLDQVKGLEPLRVRKIFEIAGQLMQGSGCLLIAFNSDKRIVIGSLVLMMVGRGTVGGGQCLIPPELSKDYPGTVFAYANTLANLAGVIGPWTITQLVVDKSKYSAWFPVWILSASIFFFCAIIFCLFAENCPQNYGRKVRKMPPRATSEAQLTFDKDPNQIFKMEAFSRVSSEPNPKVASLEQKHLD